MGLIDNLRAKNLVHLISVYEDPRSTEKIKDEGVFFGKTVRAAIQDLSEFGRQELESYLEKRPSVVAPLVPTGTQKPLEATIQYLRDMEIEEDDVRFKAQKQEAYLKTYREFCANLYAKTFY